MKAIAHIPAVTLLLCACVERRPTAQLSFHVISDSGTPVKNAEIWAATFHHWQPGEGFGKDVLDEKRGKTDGDGNISLTFPSLRGDVRYAASGGNMFYRTSGMIYQFKEVNGKRWEPWNPTIDVVLKPILKPIPMYARKVGKLPNALRLPEAGKPIGFDLIVSDWVAPYGKGMTTDFAFNLERRFTSVEEPFDATLSVTFANEGDGIQSVLAAPFVGSELKLPRYAPEHGYASELIRRTGRPAANKPIQTTTREDQNYVFRVRTVLDEKKQVKSALFGKIDGDIRFDVINGNPCYLLFTYYLNPTANDRNLEFDMERNMFPQLPELERPTLP